MKKVLFIIQSYPSNRSANVLCDDRIMKAMLDKGGYEIHCLAYRFHGQKLNELMNGIRVHRFRRGLWWNLYTYARDNDNNPFYRFIVKLDRLYMRLRQLLYIPIYPDYEPFLAKLVAKEAIKLHSKEHFDLVIAEHHGRDTLYAGSQLKKHDENVILVSILWDPFSGKDLAKYLPHKYAYHMMSKDENRILSLSDCIISMHSNKGYQEKFSKDKAFFKKMRFLDIPGIIKPAEHWVKEAFTKADKINMLYSGLLSVPDRDPSILIEMIQKSKFADKVNLMFFVTGEDGIAMAKKRLHGFNGNSIIHSYVQKDLLDSIASHSDVLINIGGPNPRMVPSKIFEYMSLGKPILSTFYIDNDSSKDYLDKYPAAICIDIRKQLPECIRAFEYFIENKLKCKVSFDEVENKFPLNSPNKYIEVFEELLDKKS